MRSTELGFLSWSLAPSAKKLTYTLSGWFARFSGAECPDGVVYTSEGHGFVCFTGNHKTACRAQLQI